LQRAPGLFLEYRTGGHALALAALSFRR
jgi:hypothetical protein